jgi:hypothetical protein
MMYQFSEKELDEIQFVMEVNQEFGPRAAFRFYHKLSDRTIIPTEDVEDFIISFMSQYNAKHPMTY